MEKNGGVIVRLVIVATVIVLLLSGCNSEVEETNSSTTSDNNQNNEQAAEQEPNEQKEKEGSTSSEETKTNNKKDAEESKEKEKAAYILNEGNWTLKPKGEDADPQKVLMTIDDAPDTYSLEMAKTLKEKEVPAIFFVNGHFLQSEEGREQLKEIHELGFEIGNHTMTHANLREISKEDTKKEIVELNNLVEEIIGERPTYFRAPFGVNTDASKEILKNENMTWMNWTYGYDWEAEYRDAEALADIMVNTQYLTDGANLLMHDREWTNQALDMIIKGFREKDYGFIDPDQIEKNE